MGIFQGINDEIRAFADDDAAVVYFVCECTSELCLRSIPLRASQYDELRALGRARILSAGCRQRPRILDVVLASGVGILIEHPDDLAEALRGRVAVPVRDVGLPVEGAPAG